MSERTSPAIPQTKALEIKALEIVAPKRELGTEITL